MPSVKYLPLQNGLVKFRTVLIACFLSMFSLHPVWADDTEIYFNSVNKLRPNLLFVLDTSLSMRSDDRTGISRLARLQSAMDEVLDRISDDVNVGLMSFGGADGGRIVYPVTHVVEPGVKDDLKQIINGIELLVGTPTVGALEEALRYYSGDSVKYGLRRTLNPIDHSLKLADLRDTASWVGSPRSRVSHPDSYTGGTVEKRPEICDIDPGHVDCREEHISGSPIYKSPVVSECQANYVILLTDGQPWLGPFGPSFRDEYNKTLELGKRLNGDVDCEPHTALARGTERQSGTCGEEFAAYMYEEENIITHTIGFNFDVDWLADVAAASVEGEYREAGSSAELIDVIDQFVGGINDSGATIVAPAVTIDQFTRLSHREEIYLALFQPQASTRWAGNLKKYKFNGADPTLKDAEGNNAVDANTGEFLSTSRSFWSETPDGNNVLTGGAAHRLVDPDSRNLYSDLETGTTDLTAIGNRISANNIDPELFDLASDDAAVDDAVRDNYVRWLSGVDVIDQNNDGS